METAAPIVAELRVIYGDTDQMGVVYYANYFRYFEFSRSEFFRACGGSYVELEKSGFGLPVVEAHCQYKRPARYEDVLTIEVALAQLKRASLRFEYRMARQRDQTLIAVGHTVHACVDAAGKPTGLPPYVLKLLAPALK